MLEIWQNGMWADGTPREGQLCRKVIATTVGNAYEEFIFSSESVIETDLTILKAEKILGIKAEAERRIHLLDWRLERAKERETLSIVGYETVNDIYQQKEEIRQWSNQVEVKLMQLESIEQVSEFTF
ncbi:TPA: hypothetical protein RQJ82_002228 [Vibrio vulnificus]|uniref:hypothetical protein n=1 Tax=Vibrio vulnificus TaxID=672 RepID=UPI000AABFD0C|nr:hypothetical protein [Vibrio vulnificus]HAS6385927.1 hypothetical protein [Vibrio vulnificus]HDY7620007.1 hypothetical protein [Vibrio vulnificus]HDY7624969.1 hypothetical protein [Vibrio vulnificus]HDY8174819.1 hypothetical protein [Vibrio vulnificus]HDZ3715259.1 hypothetical protein [Vibrio vulnificus]